MSKETQGAISKRSRKKVALWIILGLVAVFCVITAIQFHYELKAAYERLSAYDVMTIDTEFGTMSYVDEGIGEAILISHGIFGGYDQGYASLSQLVGNGYRILSISRFGYPGSELPDDPTPANQAQVFLALLDELQIDRALHYDEYPIEDITAPVLVVHAKDDPMAKFDSVELLLSRIDAETAIFETGGHLIAGHGVDVSRAIENFISGKEDSEICTNTTWKS